MVLNPLVAFGVDMGQPVCSLLVLQNGPRVQRPYWPDQQVLLTERQASFRMVCVMPHAVAVVAFPAGAAAARNAGVDAPAVAMPAETLGSQEFPNE